MKKTVIILLLLTISGLSSWGQEANRIESIKHKLTLAEIDIPNLKKNNRWDIG